MLEFVNISEPAHSAFDLMEFASCLQKAYEDCKVVEVLSKFTNFTNTVKNMLNTANTTIGADHFSEFRYFRAWCSSESLYLKLHLRLSKCSLLFRSFKFFGEQRVINGRSTTVGVVRCQLNYRCFICIIAHSLYTRGQSLCFL
jgi:hypothetical protein